ncbi:MAG: hypothetical protein GF417_07335 [Candidatus Latescibacteria bacterium]|nr:hypothetical protein [bacterium]MBD3424232.1 hypothetical protein [Candidatus Latescibacterota bacterium]
MNRPVILSLALFFLLISSYPAGAAGTSRTDFPNDFGIELGGKSIVYSFTYQRMFGSQLGLEGGISALGGGDSDDNSTIIFFPLGAKAYLLNRNGSPFLTGGVVIISASVDSGPFDDSIADAYSYAGLGFEYRAEGGFIFRGTAYALIADDSFFIWPGLHVGYAF